MHNRQVTKRIPLDALNKNVEFLTILEPAKEEVMQIDSKKMESMIRYWVILEELKRKKNALLAKADHRGAILLTPTSLPDSDLERLPVPVRVR